MALDDKTVKIVLIKRDMPTHWYNMVQDLPEPALAAIAPGHRPAAAARPIWRPCPLGSVSVNDLVQGLISIGVPTRTNFQISFHLLVRDRNASVGPVV